MFSEDQVFSDRPVKLPAACEAMLREYKERERDPNSTRVDWSTIEWATHTWTEGTATIRGTLEERKRKFRELSRALKRVFPAPKYSTSVMSRG